jgi:serpin peptidase inhibitor clade H protein 1
MHSLLFLGIFCLLPMTLAAEVKKPTSPAAPGTAEKLSPKAATLAERSTGLAFSLYEAMAKDQAVENILVSPVVVASSLGLVSLGGKAATASQAKAVLSAEQLRDEEVHAGLGELLRSLSNSTARNVTWKLGSRLYGPSSVSFADDFVRSSKQHYNCEHSKINFRDKRSALQSINEWASQTTDGKLPEVTKDVERTDGALLVNAMFFKRESMGGGGRFSSYQKPLNRPSLFLNSSIASHLVLRTTHGGRTVTKPLLHSTNYIQRV